MKKYLAAAAAVAAVAAICVLAPGALAAAQTVCPPGGISDTTITGGLLVTGDNYCLLYNDTINGGVTIQGGSDIELDASTVSGGITVMPDGEIEANPGSVFGDTPTTSTVYGGITLNNPNDWDIETTTVFGGLSVDGANPENQPSFCGNHIIGSVGIRNVSFPVSWFGDSTDEFVDCPGNTISGSFSLTNASFFEVEGNSIGGSVFLNASDLQFNGNTVGGSLICSNGTTVESGSDQGDPSGNTVGGKNTC